jgi:protein-disulfide isomerase
MKLASAAVNTLSATLAICTVVLTATVVSREVDRRREPGDAPRSVGSVVDWRSLAAKGQRSGTPSAPVVLVEFADFQCPACAELNRMLRDVTRKYGPSVAVVYRHFPLQRIHPFAYNAALAAECAATQGRFASFRDVLFERQDSLGSVSWTRLAEDANVGDPARLARCVDTREFADRVAEDTRAGHGLDMRGTPLLLVNGQRFDGVPPEEVLESAVRDELAKATRAGRANTR